MKKLVFAISIMLIATSCANQSDNQEQDVVEVIEIQAIPMLSIADFDTEAGNYVNEEVQLEGIVDHVCKHGGKKLLLVNDDGDVHITTDEDRFSDDLIGEEIIVNGIVEEFRVDEEYCLQMEEDNIKNHSEGETDDELYERKMHSIQAYRDSMQNEGVDHLSYYSLVYVSMEILEDETVIVD